MIKVFQLIDSIQLGGAEIIALNISEYCKIKNPDELEFFVVELFHNKDSYSQDKTKEILTKNIKIISLDKISRMSKRVNYLIVPFTLLYYLFKEKPQIIHSHTDLPDFVLSISIRILSFFHIRTPKIVRTIHNTNLWEAHPLLGKFTETAFKDDSVVGVSASALEAYNNLRIKNNLRVSQNQQIIYNGCAIPQRKSYPFLLDKEKINIAFCGRFENQKGIDILIERIKILNLKFSNDFIFHIIGDGSFRDDVINLSKENANVLVYDPVTNISDKLFVFNFLIIPSRFEGLGLISLEASLSNVPVIAAFALGLSETLPTDWPLQFHLDNEDELIMIFEKIKNNEYDLDVLKKQAYSFVSDKFSHEKMIDAYSKLYLEINE